MQRTINRFSEMEIINNQCIVITPYSKLSDTVTIESFEKGYVTKVSQLLESKNVLFSTNISSNNSFIMMPFSLSNYMTFPTIRSFDWILQLKLFKQLVEIAKLGEQTNTVFLWENENFFINTEEERVVALLFAFSDYPINNPLPVIEGLKRMIFNSLTTLDYQSGKPKRTDFVDQSDRTIDFANKMLLANQVSDVEKVIDETVEEHREQQERAAEAQTGGLFKRRSAATIADETYQQLIKKSLLNAQTKGPDKKEYKSKKSVFNRFKDWIFTTKGMIWTSVTVVLLTVVAFVILPAIISGSSGPDSKTIQKNKDVVLKAYQNYITEDKDKAYALLDKVGYSNLPSKEDKKILLHFYYEQKKYTKAIQADPDSVYEIGDVLIDDKKFDELNKLDAAVKNKVLDFDVSTINKEYQQTVLLFPELTQFNERRSNEGIRAFYLTNQADEINDFIKKYSKKNENTEDPVIKQNILTLTEINVRFAEEYQFYQLSEKEYNEMKSSKASDSELKSKKKSVDTALEKIQQLYVTSSDPTGGTEN